MTTGVSLLSVFSSTLDFHFLLPLFYFALIIASFNGPQVHLFNHLFFFTFESLLIIEALMQLTLNVDLMFTLCLTRKVFLPICPVKLKNDTHIMVM